MVMSIQHADCVAAPGAHVLTTSFVLQAGRHEHNESYAYYRDISKLNMTNPGGRTDDLR